MSFFLCLKEKRTKKEANQRAVGSIVRVGYYITQSPTKFHSRYICRFFVEAKFALWLFRALFLVSTKMVARPRLDCPLMLF